MPGFAIATGLRIFSVIKLYDLPKSTLCLLYWFQFIGVTNYVLHRNMFFLSNPTPEGYLVYYISVKDCFAKVFDHTHEAARLLMLLELSLLKKPECTSGYIVFDCAGVHSTVYTMLSPAIAAYSISCFQVSLINNRICLYKLILILKNASVLFYFQANYV